MQTNYSSFKQGDVVLVDMGFSNLEESKLRPGLVISSTEYNKHGEDIVLLKITSQTKERPFNVLLSHRDLASGHLNFDSVVKADFPIAVEKRRVLKTIAVVQQKIVQQTKEKLRQVFEI